MIKEAELIKTLESGAQYRETISPQSSNLSLLTCGRYELSPSVSTSSLVFPQKETLLFCMEGEGEILIDKKSYPIKHYDAIYIPQRKRHIIKNNSGENLVLASFRAQGKEEVSVIHSSFKKISSDKKRIRKLKGKDVYIMFGEDEGAQNLTGGYTFFEPFSRSWPIHLHEDQEEIYLFIKGHGAMEVFENEEKKTFVKEVKEGDAVTIPMENYHPVFSFDKELHFIWVIAGARYWVGDKDKSFIETAKKD